MANMNSVNITGNLGKDPELRATSGGTAVMSFSLAVSERRKIGEQWSDYTHWVPVFMIGKRAESLAPHLHKGSKVGVTGKLNYSEWTKDGQKRSKVEVKAEDIELLSPKKDGSQGYQNGSQDDYSEPQYTQPSVYDEDIPF